MKVYICWLGWCLGLAAAINASARCHRGQLIRWRFKWTGAR
jgi:hypothetical protein